MTMYRAPGWLGVRLSGRYWILRDINRHPATYSERNRIATRRLARVGRWQLWVRSPETPRWHW